MADVEHSVNPATEATAEPGTPGAATAAGAPSSELFFIAAAAQWSSADQGRSEQYSQWEESLDEFRHANPEGYKDYIAAIKYDPRVQQQMPQLTLMYLKAHYGELHSALIAEPVIPQDAIDNKLKRDQDLGIESIFLEYASANYEALSNLVTDDGENGDNEIALSKSDLTAGVFIDHALYLQDNLGDALTTLQVKFGDISQNDGKIQIEDLQKVLMSAASGNDEPAAAAALLALRRFGELTGGDMHDGDFYWKPLFEFGFGNNDAITRSDLQSLREDYSMLQEFGITPETTAEARRVESEYKLSVHEEFVKWQESQPPVTTMEERHQQAQLYNEMLAKEGKATHPLWDLLSSPVSRGLQMPGYYPSARDFDANGNRGYVQGP